MSAIALYARATPGFDSRLATTRNLLVQAALAHSPDPSTGQARLALACSLGAEDMVLLHLAQTLALPLRVFVLDTGHLHASTLALLAQLRSDPWLEARLEVYQPQAQSVLAFVQREGDDAMRRSVQLRKACCHIRKIEPLTRALQGRTAWITGLRREQSEARADVPLLDESNAERSKYNPLALWSWADVWHYIQRFAVPYHPLHDQFYPSIGCAPCTRAIAVGEDFRAGRWWWEQGSAKECGLHINTAEPLPHQQAAQPAASTTTPAVATP